MANNASPIIEKVLAGGRAVYCYIGNQNPYDVGLTIGELINGLPDTQTARAALIDIMSTLEKCEAPSTNSMSAHGEWISIEDRSPDNGVHVLLCCETRPNRKQYVCDGFYAAKYGVEAYVDCDLDCDYSEENDAFYLPEGYYEVVKNWDDYSSIVIGDFVTHWMPLPEPPEEEARNEKA